MLTEGPRGQFQRWCRSRKRLSVCSVLRCPGLWLQCSVTVAVHGLEKTHHGSSRPLSKHEKRTAGSAWETWTVAAADGVRCAHGASFLNRALQLYCCTVITDLDPSIRSTQKALFLLRHHLWNWPRCPSVRMRSELLVMHEKLGQFPLLTVYVCARVRWEINFLLTFETAPFFCEHTVFINTVRDVLTSCVPSRILSKMIPFRALSWNRQSDW
jgi:hypothetical protein